MYYGGPRGAASTKGSSASAAHRSLTQEQGNRQKSNKTASRKDTDALFNASSTMQGTFISQNGKRPLFTPKEEKDLI